MKDIFYPLNRSRRKGLHLALLIFGAAAMMLVDVFLQLSYGQRSLVKGILFLILPLIYSRMTPGFHLLGVFGKGAGKKGFLSSLLLGVLVYGGLMGLYLLIQGFLDLKQIESAIVTNMSVDRENFLPVALYISFGNSLLEEFFFRGFGCLKLGEKSSRLFAYSVSAALFALYHLPMVSGWTSPLITGLGIFGLFLSGIFFNLLNAGKGNLYNSYMVHMFANFAINTIGLQMFGLIRLPFLG